MWVVVRIHGWLSSWLASQSSPAKKWSDCPWATTLSNLCKLLAIEHPWPAKPCTTTPYNRNDSWYVCKTSQIPPLLPDVCHMSPLLWDSSLIGGFQERPESFWLPVLALFEEHHLGSVPSIFPAFSELSESSARLSNHGNLHNKKQAHYKLSSDLLNITLKVLLSLIPRKFHDCHLFICFLNHCPSLLLCNAGVLLHGSHSSFTSYRSLPKLLGKRVWSLFGAEFMGLKT